MSSTPEIPDDATPAHAYRAGLRQSAGLPAVVLAATFIGIGSVCADAGLPLLWVVLATVLIWAGPAILILAGGLGAGASWVALAIAITLSSVRLLPMVVSIVPYLRAGGARTGRLLVMSHVVAISMWVEGIRILPGLPPRTRGPFYMGLATGLILVASVMSVIGYLIAGIIHPVLGAGLLFLTPIFFLVSLLSTARDGPDHLPVIAGFGGLLVAAPFGDGLELFWAGVGGGTLAFVAMEMLRRRRSRPS